MSTQHEWPLPKSQWTRQNIRYQYRLARHLLQQSRRDHYYEVTKALKDIVREMESKLTVPQYSLEMDDFSEVSPSIHADVLAAVKAYEVEAQDA